MVGECDTCPHHPLTFLRKSPSTFPKTAPMPASAAKTARLTRNIVSIRVLLATPPMLAHAPDKTTRMAANM